MFVRRAICFETDTSTLSGTGSLRLWRVHTGLPLGLFLLQRLDVLWTQLSDVQPREGRGRSGLAPRTRPFHCGRRGVDSGQTGHGDGEAWLAAASRNSITWRHEAMFCCETKKCFNSGSSSACQYCLSELRPLTRKASRASQTHLRWEELRSTRIRTVPRTSRSRSTSSPIQIGTDERFETVRQWCLDIPEIVNISVNTPVPRHRILGYGIPHAQDTRLPSVRYSACGPSDDVASSGVLCGTGQDTQILNRRHRHGGRTQGHGRIAAGHLMRGQTNFMKMLWKFNSVYDPELNSRSPPAGGLRNDAAA